MKKETSAQNISDLLNLWVKVEQLARKYYSSASEEEIYQICLAAMRNSTK